MSSNIDKKTQAEADKTANPAVLAVIGLVSSMTVGGNIDASKHTKLVKA
ncbi:MULTISPECIES: hypothetical protein [Wolbachia]|uniref:Uncharacterized protein n=1 Tax=Wolbachia endosymbiont of Oeneis ivallda TaxID=3171168 RepID=A0AAU7YQ52_9RICK|nr:MULTISPECIES: hypothetical protein [Wolbachia]MBS9531305.1 hypothetical protein [Wolbachia endosymbiont of Rhagoletis cerasi]BDG76258.1 hypothetical protein wHmt_08160 [Wolbachia pipientis]BDG77720.1 hypothetical protein wHmc_08520 [Wolbachia pipientis]